MSSDDSYLGRSEDQRLEFKGPEVHDEDLIKLIVAFLNTEGGRLVIGVREERGIAVEELGVKEPHALLERIVQRSIAQIQPSPAGLVTGRMVFTPSGTRLVIFDVNQPKEGPYAMAKGTGLHFFVRQGAQVRNMSMGELLRRARETPPSIDEAESEDAFRRGIACAEEGAFGDGVALFVGFHPARGQLVIDREARSAAVIDPARPARWPPEHLLAELCNEVPFAHPQVAPAKTPAHLGDIMMRSDLPIVLPSSARDWSLGLAPHMAPRHEGDVIRFGREKPLSRYVEIKSTGLVWGAMRLEAGWPGLHRLFIQEKSLEPGLLTLRVIDRAALVFLLSVARLTGFFWRSLGGPKSGEGMVHARSILFSNYKVFWQSWGDPIGFTSPSDLVDPPVDSGIIQIDARSFISSPDETAIMLLSRLFVASGSYLDSSRVLNQLRSS